MKMPWWSFLVVVSGVVVAGDYGNPPLVIEAHDKFPARHSDIDKDCDSCACLAPDGDHDCDDPVKSVPEPAALVLFGTGVVGLALSWRRRRE